MSAASDIGAHDPSTPQANRRRTLSVREVAARLEHRLYLSGPTDRAVQDGCALAITHGLSSVIVRPEVVARAARRLAGTSVGVVTIPGWGDDGVQPLAAEALLAEARRLAADGATDLGMLANAERLAAGDGRPFAEEVVALVGAMHASGARVRVILDTDGLTPEATTAACQLLGATGAWLVQGGSWLGTARTGLSRIQHMRAALPDHVSLKWTFPVRSLDSMMICIGERVDRFNGDPESILEHAARRVAYGPLIVPSPETDY